MKKEFNKKKLLMFGIPILAIGLVAAVLTYYAVFNVILNVNQPISVTGDLSQPVSCDAGDTCLSDNPIRVSNSDDEDRVVIVTDNSGDNIDVSYVGKLLLENKDASWGIIVDTTKADLIYSVVGEEFEYELKAIGLENIEYALIYYADSDPRFEDWGGNPALLLGTGTAVDGELVIKGSADINSLPYESDWNKDCISGENYCGNANGFDSFDHCYGAKIWLVPKDNYNEGEKTIQPNWNPSSYLFETDLIWYSKSVDSDDDGVVEDTLTVPANSFIEFYPAFTSVQHTSDEPRTIQITVA